MGLLRMKGSFQVVKIPVPSPEIISHKGLKSKDSLREKIFTYKNFNVAELNL